MKTRTLRVTSPYMQGPDVLALKRSINRRLKARNIDYRVDVESDVYGPRAHKGALKAMYYLGITRASCGMGTKNPKRLTPKAQEYIRLQRDRNKWQIARGRKRTQAAQPPSGPTVAVAWAKSKVGVKEQPAGSNKGPQISAWQEHWVGWAGYSWCGAFAGYALEQGGLKGLVGERIIYTPYIVQDAKVGRNGFVRWEGRDSKPGKGWLVLFNWDGGVVDHVGIATGAVFSDGTIETIEGNTSLAGSQSNGGEVMVRRRPRSLIEGFAVPRW